MIRRVLIVMAAVLVAGLVGCGKDEPKPQSETVKTTQELKADAQKEITADNLDAELAKLEKEIDADQ